MKRVMIQSTKMAIYRNALKRIRARVRGYIGYHGLRKGTAEQCINYCHDQAVSALKRVKQTP